MLQTLPFPGRLTTSVADGDSLRYYPAYDVPSLASLPPQAPVAAENRAQLLLVQRLDGSLTIGDTHEYDEPFAFDVDEERLRSPGRPRLRAARRRAAAGAAALGRRLQRGHRHPGALPPLDRHARRGPGDRPGRARHDLLTRDRRGDLPVSRFSVVCLDMAGTTVRDDNTVMDAFAAAIASRNLPVAEFNSGMKYAQGDDGPVEDRGVPAHPRGRRTRPRQRTRPSRSTTRARSRPGTSPRCPAPSNCSPPAGPPGSRSACPPDSPRSPATRSSPRSAGRRWSTCSCPPPTPAAAGPGRTCR